MSWVREPLATPLVPVCHGWNPCHLPGGQDMQGLPSHVMTTRSMTRILTMGHVEYLPAEGLWPGRCQDTAKFLLCLCLRLPTFEFLTHKFSGHWPSFRTFSCWGHEIKNVLTDASWGFFFSKSARASVLKHSAQESVNWSDKLHLFLVQV